MTTEHRSDGRRVGELAAATGLTVRTLHYYGEIGLLVASTRTDAGHRLYADADVERLYRICLLRRLGLPLGEIARALDDPEWELHSAMATRCDHELAEPPGAARERDAGVRESTDR
jgi:MerR family transcriptional regulator, thiopeptide resistance regulator